MISSTAGQVGSAFAVIAIVGGLVVGFADRILATYDFLRDVVLRRHRTAAATRLDHGSWASAHAQLKSAYNKLYRTSAHTYIPGTNDLLGALRQILKAVPADRHPAQPIVGASTTVALKIGASIELLGARDGAPQFSDVDGRTVRDAASDVFAVLTKDLNRIGAEATNVPGRLNRLAQLAQPGNSAVRALDTWSLAVQELSRRGRAGDSATVTALRGRINEMTAADQTTVQHALTAICDATRTLAKIPSKQRNQPNGDGSTPSSDAATVIDLATEAVNAAARSAVDGDVDQLRILRRYAKQWEHDPGLGLPAKRSSLTWRRRGQEAS